MTNKQFTILIMIIVLGFYAVWTWGRIEFRKLDQQQNMDRVKMIKMMCKGDGGYFKDHTLKCRNLNS